MRTGPSFARGNGIKAKRKVRMGELIHKSVFLKFLNTRNLVNLKRYSGFLQQAGVAPHDQRELLAYARLAGHSGSLY